MSLKYEDIPFPSPKLKARQIPGWELDYFNQEEWLNVQDRLDERDREDLGYTPRRRDLFRALTLCSYADCVCGIIGESPYPNPSHASGLAFEMRGGSLQKPRFDTAGGQRPELYRVPPTLANIFKELESDLDIKRPDHGCLENWCRQGVLLWNAMPVYPPLADFGPLTQEIVERLSAKGKIVFVFVGKKAQAYERYVDQFNNRVISVSHPSPRGQLNARSRFVGSRVFSTVNAHLNHYLKEPIDWNP